MAQDSSGFVASLLTYRFTLLQLMLVTSTVLTSYPLG